MGYVNKTYLSTQFKNFADKIAKVFSKIGHTHLKSDITDFPTSMPANGGNAATVGGHTVGVNVPSNAKFTDTTYGVATSSALGLVKSGTDITVDSTGNVSVNSADKVGHTLSIGVVKGAAKIYTFDGSQDVNFDIQIPTTAKEVGAVPISGGIVNGTITFGKSDDYGIRTNTNNWGRVGDETNQFYQGYFHEIYEDKTSLSNKYLQLTGDSKDNIVTFTSNDSITGDSTAPALLKSGETHASIFSKVSTIFKNVRWLLSKMGTTDISAIGNGTVTGALSTLNSKMAIHDKIMLSSLETTSGYNHDANNYIALCGNLLVINIRALMIDANLIESDTVCVLPEKYRPKININDVVWSYQGNYVTITIDSDGHLRFRLKSGAKVDKSTTVYKCATYPLD